jgi:hypothetical protein
MASSHAADADDGFRQFVAGRRKALSAQDMARDDGQAGRSGNGRLDKIAAGDGSLDGRLLFKGL